MNDPQTLAKAVKAMQLQGILFLMAGVAFMVVAVLWTKQGRSGAVWIGVGAMFLALGGSALGRAKKLGDSMNQQKQD